MVVGDGEAETGSLGTSWQMNKFPTSQKRFVRSSIVLVLVLDFSFWPETQAESKTLVIRLYRDLLVCELAEKTSARTIRESG